MNRSSLPPWRPEDQRSWEELERRAAAQAREFYTRAEPAPPPPPPAPAPAPQPSPSPKKKLLGHFSGDQLLLAALLCLLVQEEAEPQLILAVAYILIS